MDDFLAKLYEEEQEKIAAADLGNFMSTLLISELEDYLELDKLAVAGPPEPELPNAARGKLDKEQKSVEAEVAKKEKTAEAPPTQPQKIHKKGLYRRATESEALGKTVGGAVGGTTGAGAGFLGGGLTAKAIGDKLKSRGKSLGYKGALATTAAGMLLGAAGGSSVGSRIGAASARVNRRGWKGVDKLRGSRGVDPADMPKTAAAKAEIVARTMHVTAGAPEHIKMAAAELAGAQIAKVAADDRYTMRPSSWGRGQRIQTRAVEEAMRRDPSLKTKKVMHGASGLMAGGALGTALGVGGGALVSALSKGKIKPADAMAIGGLSTGHLGAVGGGLYAMQRSQRDALAAQGVKQDPLMLGRGRMTPKGMGTHLTRPEGYDEVVKQYKSAIKAARKREAKKGIAKTSGAELNRVKTLDRNLQMKADDQGRINKLTSPGRRGFRGAVIGSVLGTGAGYAIGGKPLALPGAAIGALTGGVSGTVKAKRLREALKERELAKAAMVVSMRTTPTSMDPEVAGQQGARSGRVVGGLAGLPIGLMAGSKALGGTKGKAVGAALGALGGVGAGHLIGKASGKKSSELRRAAMAGDMRARMDMYRQLRAERAGK